MRPVPALLGSLLTLATLTGADFDEESVGAPPEVKTPVLYDVANPTGLYKSIERDPELQLAYAEQVLKALSASVKEDSRSPTKPSSFLTTLSPSTPGTFTVNVSMDEQGNLVVNGHTKMEPDSPYVYADNIIWTSPACDAEGRSHLTHGFRKQDVKGEVSQSVWTGMLPQDTKSSVDFRDEESLSVAGEEHQTRLAQYKEVAKQVACEIESALK